jgi:toxin CcdB
VAQFDIYENTNRSTKTLYPYLLEIQADLLSELHTTVVIPLAPATGSLVTPLKGLHPTLEIEEELYLAITTLIAGVDRRSLGKKTSSIKEAHDRIISSIDLMITGI